MSHVIFAAEALDQDASSIESSDLMFLEDSSYEFVGGGDGYNGY